MSLPTITPEQADFYIAVAIFALLLVFICGAAYRKSSGGALIHIALVPNSASLLVASDWEPAELTEWYPPDDEHKPLYPGRYRVRMPWVTVESIQLADWDGKCWRDRTNGRQCYFQNLSWQGIKIQSAARDK
ncbi:MAG TPA: hypothetical protein VEC35_01130 [Noviherbaspirillum sp.]|nr:hypothetical protein [Noviherbaspirillum sp.]